LGNVLRELGQLNEALASYRRAAAGGPPDAEILKTYTGSWYAVFAVAAIMNFIVVLMALFVVRPMRISISASENKAAVGHAHPAE
jgi:hypothetical protein